MHIEEIVSTEELRRNVMKARIQRFFTEHDHMVEVDDPWSDGELKVVATPTDSGVAFSVAVELSRSMVSSVSRYFSVISQTELEYSFSVLEQTLYFNHHLVAEPTVDDAGLAAAVERLNSCVKKHLPSLRYFEEVSQ